MLHIIYTTFPTEAAASLLARDLVRRELVACVNVMAPHQSFYQWKGEQCEEREVALWCKAPEHLVAAASAHIRENHPYETPCIVAWPVSHCEGAYHEWVAQVTQGQ